ncbi:MAG: hypothetical protein QM758_01705 [Armatimonas sp.]
MLYYAADAAPVPGIFAQRQHAPTLTPDGGATLNPDALVKEVRECVIEVLAKHRRVLGFWERASV